jgi:hypothetical protein
MKIQEEEKHSTIQKNQEHNQTQYFNHGHGCGRSQVRNNSNKKYLRRYQDPPHKKDWSRKGQYINQVKRKICLHNVHYVEKDSIRMKIFPRISKLPTQNNILSPILRLQLNM